MALVTTSGNNKNNYITHNYININIYDKDMMGGIYMHTYIYKDIIINAKYVALIRIH